MNTTEACIALNMVPKMGPVRLRKLLEVFETPRANPRARSGASFGSRRNRQRSGGSDRQLGKHGRSAGGTGTHPRIRRERHHAGIAALSAPAARNPCAANRALRLGRT